ncbi:long-chain fatty acid--CoA ligase [Bradyrhizobium jicamae]|uniref:Long-chain fatty acid--CoA ligase n=1 Tax=Bradyrhizobium jicamae TaxID=280332 RepID=A0ABS5FQ19_9BRAD|nr:fatty acid--CoA ligase family protein [Bradyrhizobium jicamae]MBR0798891.1 long-chain fatty acid--CoA ligase [Bradyrhizobium jicamae]MBR0938589.1 long-chain fatty acid--CoA ligase [Bradyrhizobium jicamae]
MSRPDVRPLRGYLGTAAAGRTMSDAHRQVSLTGMAGQTWLGGRLFELTGRSVLLDLGTQLQSAIGLAELDGVAQRMLLLPPDVSADHLASLVKTVAIDAVVSDDPARWMDSGIENFVATTEPQSASTPTVTARTTEWLMLTSGTSGVPKVVSHTLAGLSGAIVADTLAPTSPVWATFYDIRRYGGLQILLRAMIGGGSMVLSDPKEAMADWVARLHAHGVTHISGTPTHWRKLLMSGAADGFAPRYVRLSGEIADQPILDALKQTFPAASVGHAYASTEAGVGFAVNDGREGFPESMLNGGCEGVDMKIEDGSLRIRSGRVATGYVGSGIPALTDADGFVDTGDMVEVRGGRCYFVGRRGGIINIGGRKVHPEEIEAVINSHPGVRMSRARARKSPITGAIVAADIVLAEGYSSGDSDAVRDGVLAICRAALEPHKVPAVVRFVPTLAVTSAGKLARTDA